MSYKINDRTFETFEEVIKYAQDEFKMEFLFKAEELDEESRQSACEELEHLLNDHGAGCGGDCVDCIHDHEEPDTEE
jgi:hypothetical protein